MVVEESKKVRLVDEDKNTLCSFDAVYIYDEDNCEDEGELLFIHPMTGNRNQIVDQCLQGWSEQDEVDNKHWSKLVECIGNDKELLNRLYYSDEIEYVL